MISYLLLFIFGMIVYQNVYLSFLAGVLWIAVGFNVMHDASHFALFLKPEYNILASKIWNTFGTWNEKIWFYHHAYAHHSFTGDEQRDPDLMHYRPFAKKFKSDKAVIRFFSKIQTNIISFVAIVLPGMYVGQTISYLISIFRLRIWRVKLPN